MRQDRIEHIETHLVSTPVTGGYTDATRKVETIGFVVVRVRAASGLEGIGVTYHEVGGEATSELIRRNIAPKLMGRDPLETDALWTELFHYLRGVGRKGLTYCAIIPMERHADKGNDSATIPSHQLTVSERRGQPQTASRSNTAMENDTNGA